MRINHTFTVLTPEGSDAKLYNYYMDNGDLVIESIQDYLTRVPVGIRPIGRIVCILANPDHPSTQVIPIELLSIALRGYTSKYYHFEGGQADENFVEVLLNSKPGKDGATGKSAYEVALEQGFEGNVIQWLNSLIGYTPRKGIDYFDGKDGKDGIIGRDGVAGKSAYELAILMGYQGTLTEWLEYIKGRDGDVGLSAYEVAVQNGYIGTIAEWLESLKGLKGDKGDKGDRGDNGYSGSDGADGKSSYELAVLNGFVGTVNDWLISLHGSDGNDGNDGQDGAAGKSAYQTWLDLGNVGTEQDFIDYLKIDYHAPVSIHNNAIGRAIMHNGQVLEIYATKFVDLVEVTDNTLAGKAGCVPRVTDDEESIALAETEELMTEVAKTTKLSDMPQSLAGFAGNSIRVKSDESGWEFYLP